MYIDWQMAIPTPISELEYQGYSLSYERCPGENLDFRI